MTRQAALVAWREISERTRSRAFAVSSLAIVALVVAAVVVPGLTDDDEHLRAGLTGATPPALTPALRAAAAANDAELELRRYASLAAGEAAVRGEDVDVLIVSGRQAVYKSEPDARFGAVVSSALERLALDARAARIGLTPAQTATLLEPSRAQVRVLEPSDPDQEARERIAFVGYLILLMALIWYGNAVAEGVAQEKGGRIMEVLLSRVRARDLLAGKVIGIGLVGLLQMLLALLASGVAVVAVDTLDVPSAVPAALAVTVLWFVLGYAFWSVAFAAVGALVSRTEDLQSAVSPLAWVITLSALCAVFAADSPDAWYMRVASLVPVTAPFVVPVRVAVGDVAPVEFTLAVVITLIATYALVRLAAAVYSGALLETGARPGLREVWRAARTG